MSRKAKGRVVMGLLLCVVAVLAIVTVVKIVKARSIIVKTDQYYTWGIPVNSIDIVPGQIITEITFTLQGITSKDDNSSDKLDIYLVDNPPTETNNGWVSNKGDITGEDVGNRIVSRSRRIGGSVTMTDRYAFSPPIIYSYTDSTPGKETVTFKLSTVDREDSWAWDVFKKPFNLTLSGGDPNVVAFSSSVLEFIDYAGTGTAVGILIDPEGDNYFEIDGIIMTLQIENYEGTYEKKIQAFPVDFGENKPPVLL